jgi:hypothetical protein
MRGIVASIHQELERATPVLCLKCGAEQLRPSRLRSSDAGELALLRYPVRCHACHHRRYVSIVKIFKIQHDAKRRGWKGADNWVQRYADYENLLAFAVVGVTALIVVAFIVYVISLQFT